MTKDLEKKKEEVSWYQDDILTHEMYFSLFNQINKEVGEVRMKEISKVVSYILHDGTITHWSEEAFCNRGKDLREGLEEVKNN